MSARTSTTTLNNNGAGQGETPMSASYDAANRMGQITLNLPGASQTYALSYDAAGNLTSKQNTANPADKTVYTWDAQNKLSQISQTGASAASNTNASYTYDAFGRRIQATLQNGSNPAQTVQYLYEGAQALGEIRNGQLSHRLLTGLSLDETIARIALTSNGQKDSTNSRIYLTDALNSVIAQLSDDTTSPGQLQNSYAYSPYGEASTVGPDGTNNPNQYTSRENDGTGLMFYRARYYDPVLKHFISDDPIGLAGGMNQRSYVESNPVSFRDPTGLYVNNDINYTEEDDAEIESLICDYKNNPGIGAWERSFLDRKKYPGDLNLRAAEHYLYAQSLVADGGRYWAGMGVSAHFAWKAFRSIPFVPLPTTPVTPTGTRWGYKGALLPPIDCQCKK